MNLKLMNKENKITKEMIQLIQEEQGIIDCYI